MANEDGQVRIVYNGEVYNYRDLRRELEARGHVFRTRSDTEVLVHGYEQWGEAMLDRLNGQFAFAIYDRRMQSVFLARDRFGILPLYYAERDGDLYFASEVKALLASGEVDRGVDPEGLDEVFTFWGARPPRTPFRGVRALEPGCCARWGNGRLHVRRYYALDYPEAADQTPAALPALDELLRSAVGVRPAPAPLYLLSRLTREHGIKVVLSGEGSDEVFFGYDLFKDTVVRLRCWQRPGSMRLPRLLDRLYPDLAPEVRKGAFWRGYFLSAGSPGDPLFSHLPRFGMTARIKDFYAEPFRASLRRFDPLAELRESLPPQFARWPPLGRTAYL